MALNLSFWAEVASSWARTLTASDRSHIEQQVTAGVEADLADLAKHNTAAKIRPALEAIMADDEDDEEDEW